MTPRPAAGTEAAESESGPERGATVIALPRKPTPAPLDGPQLMLAAEVMATVGPGDGQTWAEELAFLWTTRAGQCPLPQSRPQSSSRIHWAESFPQQYPHFLRSLIFREEGTLPEEHRRRFL